MKKILFLFLLLANLSFSQNMVVSGAGDAAVNGTYFLNGTLNGKPRYLLNGATTYVLTWSGTKWQIIGGGSFPFYESTNNVATPDLVTNWSTNYGFAPVPSVIVEGPTLSYSGAFLENRLADNGSISGSIVISFNGLGGDFFTGTIGDNLVADGKVTVSNLPTGLSAVITKNSGTELTFTLIGNASVHANPSDISNLSLTFQNSAFNSGNASAVANYQKTDISVEFIQHYSVGSSGDFTTIAAAIAGAENLDILDLAAQTFTESGLSLTKNLWFWGQGATQTIIQAHPSSDMATDRIMSINSNYGEIQFVKLTLQNGKVVSGNAKGGCISSSSPLTLISCLIQDNIADGNNNGQVCQGGAINSNGKIIIKSCLIKNNKIRNGGTSIGGAVWAGTFSNFIENSTFVNNRIEGTTNHTRYGGALICGGNDSIINCTFTNNSISSSGSSLRQGGGIYLNSTANLINCIMIGNTANEGGDIYRSGGGLNAYHCIIGVITGAGGVGIGGANINNITTNPNLQALANNGGETQTMAILTNSVAKDAGYSTGAPTLDQRGYTRVGTPDIGAFEFGGVSCTAPTTTITVTETSGLTNNDATICSAASVTLTATAGTTFLWSNAATTSSITVNPTTTTTYTVTASNGSCNTIVPQIVTVTANPTATTAQTNVACFGGSTGAASVTANGGTSPYTYLWNTTATTASITGRIAGPYSCDIKDANQCTVSKTFTITQPTTALSGSTIVSNVSCNGGSNGAVNLTTTGGTGTKTYLWSNAATTEDLTGVVVGTYTVTITDANGCTANTSGTVTQPSAFSATTSQTNVACFGASTGTLTVGVTGGTSPYSYNRGTGSQTSNSFPGLMAGSYTVTVTDANGCTATTPSATITQPTTALSATNSQTNLDCFGDLNGSASVTASGGTTPYTYLWNNSATTASITGISGGSYSCVISDANACQTTKNFTITQPVAVVASISTVESSGTTNNDGTICNGANVTLTASGGTSYAWSNNETTAGITINPSVTTTYTVTATLNGCTGTNSKTITVNSLPTAIISVVETSGIANNDGIICTGASATLTASGGTSYAWNNEEVTAALNVSPTTTTTYTVTVRDAFFCSDSESQIVTVNILPTASIAVSENSGLQANDATICIGDFVDLTASGASSVSWNTAATTATISVNPTSLTTYTATVTDANGCSDSETQTIAVSALPTPSAQSFTICFGDSIIVGSNSYNSTGVYTDTFTGINGCDSVVTTTLTVNPQITTQQVFTICNGESISVGTSTYIITGTYVDTLTAANGCDSLVTTTLTVNPIFATNNPIVICFGESYTIGDSTYTTSGVYSNLFEAITGCDSTVTTNLTILPLNTHSQTINLCSGEIYSIGNNTYSSTGTYIDTLVSAFGCDSIVTTQLTVSSPVNIATSVNEITITATATNVTYQWINCANNQLIAGATSQSYTATANGNYAVIVTQNNCSDTSICTTISTVGINELTASFNLYPNPATSNLTIEANAIMEGLTVMDLSGKVLATFTDKAAIQKLDIESLSRGMYLVRFTMNNETITKQFVKE